MRGRREIVALVIGAVVVLGLVLGVQQLLIGHDAEQIVVARVEAEITRDDRLVVREQIVWDFWEQRRRGIIRDIPLEADASIGELTVASPDAPDAADASLASDLLSVRIGEPDRRITGAHEYQIGYTIVPASIGDRTTVSVDLWGTDWTVPVRAVSARLRLPAPPVDVGCVQGPDGSTAPCPDVTVDGTVVVVGNRSLDAGEGITVRVRLAPLALDAAPTTPLTNVIGSDEFARPLTYTIPSRVDRLQLALITLGAFVVALVLGALAARRVLAHRAARGGAVDAAFGAPADTPSRRISDHQLRRLLTIEFAPPDGVLPAPAAVLADPSTAARSSGGDHARMARLVELAVARWCTVDTTGKTPVLRRTATEPSGARNEDRAAIEALFGDRESVTLGSYDKKFAAGWADIGQDAAGAARDAGWWAADTRRRRLRLTLVLVVAAILALAGVIGAVAGPDLPEAAVAAVVAGLGAGCFAGVIVPRVMRQPLSVTGSAAWLRTMSFRRFIAESDAEHARRAADAGVLLQYCAWAAAFGLLDRWMGAARAAALEVTDGWWQGPVAVHAVRSVTRSARSAATKPSSSSSSGRGGGFSSGGGRGGGGGRSW